MASEKEHLTPEEVEMLLDQSTGELRTGVREHLAGCEECRQLVQRHRVAGAMLKGLRQLTPDGPGGSCPPEDEWLSVVAGALPSAEAEKRIAHASRCDFCGTALRRAAECCSEDLSADEQKLFSELRISSVQGQRELAALLAASVSGSRGPERFHWGRTAAFWKRWALPAAAAAGLAMAFIAWYPSGPFSAQGRVRRNLARAFTEYRTTELRMPNSEYGRLREDRGESESSVDRPPSLHEAQATISRELGRKPESLEWLQLKAQADLIEGGEKWRPALKVLERLQKEEPGDVLVLMNLSIAYFQRANALNNPHDLALALERLGEVLSKEPSNTVALFNRAVVEEKLSLLNQAKKDWIRYLELDSRSGWATEARRRLNDIRKKTDASSASLLSPGQFAAVWARGATADVASLDGRIEAYTESARTSWLTAAFSGANEGPGARDARAGLKALSSLLSVLHQDTWLSDLLAAGERDSNFAHSLALLSRGYRMGLAGDYDPAIDFSARAADSFRRSGNRAGWLAADWQVLYASRLSARTAGCSASSGKLWTRISRTSYYWLQSRTLLDYADCASLGNLPEQARIWADLAARTSAEHKYPVLRLAALKVTADIIEDLRDLPGAVSIAAAGLRGFWSGGTYPLISGYNLCNTIMESATYEELWRVASIVSEEALALFPEGRDPGWKAYIYQKQGNALLMSGDMSGANASLVEARRLLKTLLASEVTENRIAEVETGIAMAELLQGKPAQAAGRLRRVRRQVERGSPGYLWIDYFTTYGRALRAIGEYKDAEDSLLRAIKAVGAGLDDVHNEQQRLVWARRMDGAYREMVRSTLSRDPALAFAWWQCFKGASLRTGYELPTSGPRRLPALPNDTVLVSYAFFPDGVNVWISRNGRLESHWIPVSMDSLGALIRRFAHHCSRADVVAPVLQSEGHLLYTILVAPIETTLRGARKAIIEPDSSLDEVPFEVLVDASGSYLGGRLTFSYSPGLAYLSGARPPQLFGSGSRVLIVGNPTAHQASGLAPLADADAEAHLVAAAFPKSKLLLLDAVTAEAILNELPETELFHFAGHAREDTLEAGLVAWERQKPEQPRLVAALQLSQSPLDRLGLVVLSACSTASVSGGSFNSPSGLARMLLASGVPQVVGSRWPVDSGATRVLMQVFYDNLRAGVPAADSLRAAQSALRSDERWRRPFYWAGFGLFGSI